MADHDEIETKAGSSVGAAFEDFMRAFEAYKEANDERLGEIERRSASDPLIDERLARIDRAIDETKRTADRLALKAERPHIGGGAPETAAVREHRQAFHAYVRKGEAAGLHLLEQKALAVTTNSGADGGYLVPAETERAVMSALKDISPIRAIASVRQVSGSVYKKPFATTGFAHGWVAETTARSTATGTPTLVEIPFPTKELYAMPAATATLLDDSAVDIDAWIAEEVRDTFAEQEGTAFVKGNGTTEPKGFMDYAKEPLGEEEWGEIAYIKTGVNSGFGANPPDKLIDLVYSLKSGYRANGTFVFNRGTQAAIRKLKDQEGNYLWQPAVAAGLPSQLMGYPVVESEDMPAIADGSYAIAFGDFRRGYLIVDRTGIRVLRDPYSQKPYVLFYTTKRVGGGVQDFNAIRLLRFAV